jgi:PKD repeat protein
MVFGSNTNPSHTYTDTGTFSVTLTVTTSIGSDSKTRSNYISVSEQEVNPTADFSGSPTNGNTPLTVTFTDLSDEGSSSITNWNWDFGDGSSSTSSNPSHTYTDAGTFSVTLTVTTSVGSDSKTRSNYISVDPSNDPPDAPSNPSPSDNESNIGSRDLSLSWYCFDTNDDPLAFDVYFGTNFPLDNISENQGSYSIELDHLHNNTTYYWNVVVSDGYNDDVVGDTWSFTTEETTTITLSPTGDTYVNSVYPDNNYCDSNNLYAGGGMYNGYRTYLIFDFSNVPSGAVIPDGGWSIFLYQWQVFPQVESGDDIVLFRSAGYWNECSVNWNNQPDRDNTDIVTTEATNNENTWIEISDPNGQTFTELFRQMVSGSLPNYGFQIWNDFNSDTYVTFRSTRYGDPVKHPRLELTYTW